MVVELDTGRDAYEQPFQPRLASIVRKRPLVTPTDLEPIERVQDCFAVVLAAV